MITKFKSLGNYLIDYAFKDGKIYLFIYFLIKKKLLKEAYIFLSLYCKLEMDCKICFERFGITKIPYVIKCGHSFCEECLEECLQSRQICPICRNKFNNMSVNYDLTEMIEKTNRIDKVSF